MECIAARSPGQFAELAPEALRTEIPKQEGMYRGSVDGQEEVFTFATAPFCHWSVHLGIPIRVGFILRVSFLIENQRPAALRSVLAVATGCAGR